MKRPLDRYARACALLLAVLVLTPLAHAQRAAAYTQGLLWKIEDRAREPSYVFGTIHISDTRVTALPDTVRKTFEAAPTLAIEVTLDPTSVLQAADRMIFKDGRELEAVAGPALFRKTAAVMSDMGMPPEIVRRMKPWALGLILSMPDADPQNVLDFVLQQQATEQKKAVVALETIDEQLAALDGMPEREQIAFLQHAVDTRDQLPGLVQRMVGAYLARDLAALWRISDEDSGDAALKAVKATLDRRLLYDRNVRMADRAEPLLKAGGAFVAVGALHLYGERGLLAELARRGYRVSRMY